MRGAGFSFDWGRRVCNSRPKKLGIQMGVLAGDFPQIFVAPARPAHQRILMDGQKLVAPAGLMARAFAS